MPLDLARDYSSLHLPQAKVREALEALESDSLFSAMGTVKQVHAAIDRDIDDPEDARIVRDGVKVHAHYKQMMVDLLERRIPDSETTFEQQDITLADGSKKVLAIAPLDEAKQSSLFEFLSRRIPYLQALARICDVPGAADVIQATLGRQTTLVNEVSKLKTLLDTAKREPEKADPKAIGNAISNITKSVTALATVGLIPMTKQMQTQMQELGKIQQALTGGMPPKVAAVLNNGTPIVVQPTMRPGQAAAAGMTVTARMASSPGAYTTLNSTNARFSTSLNFTTSPASQASVAAAPVASAPAAPAATAPVAAAPAAAAPVAVTPVAANSNAESTAPVAPAAASTAPVQAQEAKAEAPQQAAPQQATPANQQAEPVQQQPQQVTQQQTEPEKRVEQVAEPKATETPEVKTAQPEAKQPEVKQEAAPEQQQQPTTPAQEPEKRTEQVVEAATPPDKGTGPETRPAETKLDPVIAKDPAPVESKPADVGPRDVAPPVDTGPRDVAPPGSDPKIHAIDAIDAKAPEKPASSIPGLSEEKPASTFTVTVATLSTENILTKALDSIFGKNPEKTIGQFAKNAGGICESCGRCSDGSGCAAQVDSSQKASSMGTQQKIALSAAASLNNG